MAKQARAGELRTKIIIQKDLGGESGNGYDGENWVNVFDDGRACYCKWVNAYGSEVIEAKQIGLQEYATLTMRYTDKVKADCRVLPASGGKAYDIISVNDVENRHVWLEVKGGRKVESR